MRNKVPAALRRREFTFALLPLLIGLFHGLLYIFIMPPWQHYDEPTHFEYAWLLANREGLPKRGEFDQGMRREVAASMLEHHFFRYLQYRPNLLSQDEPIWLGIAQTGDRPLYYWIVSLPLRLFQGTDITFQLYLGRFVSLLFYLVSILAAYGITAELTPPKHPLRWLLPLALAILPGFTDLMSAVNNDVGATAFFSLFLWSAILSIKRGISLPVLLACAGLAMACFWTKSSVTFAMVLLPLPILFSILRGTHQRLIWIILLVAGLACVSLLITWGDAAFWYRKGSEVMPTRSLRAEAPVGSHALELVRSQGGPQVQVYQPIPIAELQQLRGKTVTLGAWIWASETVTLQTLILSDGKNTYSQKFTISSRPSFFSHSVRLDDKVERLIVILSSGAGEKPLSVYYDGLILVRGKRNPRSTPKFSDPEGSNGSWGGRPFTNLLRNGSAENAWFLIRPRIENLIKTQYPVFSPAILASLIDWPGAGWYFQAAGKQLVQTFWGKFGWGHVSLIGKHSYTFLFLITLAALAGTLLFLLRCWRLLNKPIFFLLLVAFILIWGATLFRGIDSLSGNVFLPSSRYAYPAIIPSALLISAGLFELLRPLSKWTLLGLNLRTIPILLFFLGLDILSIWSIIKYYGST